MCYQAVENPLFRENARLTRAGFASTLKGAPFKYVVDKREVSNEEIIDLFFNGELFHAEPEKAARLKAIGGTFNEPFLKFLLTASTTNLFLYIRNLSILIRRSDDETFLGELLEELTKTDGQAMQSGPYS